MFCVIGSHAINKFLFDKNGSFHRIPIDLDIVCQEKDLSHFQDTYFLRLDSVNDSKNKTKIIMKGKPMVSPTNNIVEAELTDRKASSAMLYDIIMNDPNTIFDGYFAYASIDVCLTLKMSHRFKKSKHFHKTMRDIKFLKSIGATIRDDLKAFLALREQETYTRSRPKLNKTKKDFFTDKINYIYDHDSVHESIKVNDRPAYTYFLKDGSEVFTDNNKFLNSPLHIKLSAGYEEACVLALERAIIPHNMEYRKAFTIALEKVCTTITSGTFREFCYDHYDDIVAMFSRKTFDKFFHDLGNGMIKAH